MNEEQERIAKLQDEYEAAAKARVEAELELGKAVNEYVRAQKALRDAIDDK